MKKRLVALMLGLILCLSAVGCSLVSVNEEKDMAQIVAKVDDVEITKQEYVESFESLASMYQMYGMDVTATPEELQSFQDYLLESLISTKVLEYQANVQGLNTLTTEEQAEVDASVAEEITYINDMISEEVELELAEDASLDTAVRTKELFDEITMSYFGEAMDEAALKDVLSKQFTESVLREKVRETFNQQVTIGDDEVKAFYDATLTEQKTAIETDPGIYKTEQENFERYEGQPMLYTPQGYRRVKYIKFVPEAELGTEYTDISTKMSELEAELGQLNLTDETANAARIAEIKGEYAEMKAQKEKMYEEHFATAKTDAEAAYARLEAGESFDAVMMEYTKDSDFINFEVFQQKGKLMSENATSPDWSEDLKNAAMALTTVGSFTSIIKNDEGYHILQYVGNETAGERTFDQVKDEMHALALANKQTEEWEATLDAWCNDSSIVTRYTDVIRDVGKPVG